MVALLALAFEADAAGVQVRCEQRANRSRANVDGFDLVPADGTFAGRITSGLNAATSPAQMAVNGQVGFDFDSDAGDIALGATAIAPDFIQGGTLTGSIVDAAGNTVASATAPCPVK